MEGCARNVACRTARIKALLASVPEFTSQEDDDRRLVGISISTGEQGEEGKTFATSRRNSINACINELIIEETWITWQGERRKSMYWKVN
ncbi:carboxylesterase family protein [Anopheles sinensis]|uniref:Carboxylesterase family protein n=1 Tax=Anopheles sinensis TaxID=74873 RepID=A0A084WNV1_ANOSI|nr:carboxylesterase family protein [Anopheles sinensis]